MVGWLQAIGSVFAIWGASWTTQRQIAAQARQAEDAEHRATERFYDGLRAVIDGAAKQFLKLQPVMTIDDSDDFSSWSFMFHYEEQSFTDAINTLETVRLVDLDSYELTEAIAGMKAGMVKLQHAVREATSKTRDRGEEPDYLIKDYGETTIDQLNRHYHKTVTILGGVPILTHTWADD